MASPDKTPQWEELAEAAQAELDEIVASLQRIDNALTLAEAKDHARYALAFLGRGQGG